VAVAERIPDTIWDFFNAMKNELLAVVAESDRKAIERHNKLVDLIQTGGYTPIYDELPDYTPGLDLGTPEDDSPKLSFDVPQEVRRSLSPEEQFKVVHDKTHNVFVNSCEHCRKAKYG
jgi:hypothetical protein